LSQDQIMSSANRSRKYDSGSPKRKRKQRIEDLTQSQKGAMDRFIIKESQVVLEKVQGLISFFKRYRETGFLEALEVAKGIALDMDLVQPFVRNVKLKERGNLMRTQMKQMQLPLSLQRNHLESTIFYPLLIKLFPPLQQDLNNIRGIRKILASYLLLTHCSHWITIV